MAADPEQLRQIEAGPEGGQFSEPPHLVIDEETPDAIRQQLECCQARIGRFLSAGESAETIKSFVLETLVDPQYHRYIDFDGATQRAISHDGRMRVLETRRRNGPRDEAGLLRQVRERRTEIFLERTMLAGRLGEASLGTIE